MKHKIKKAPLAQWARRCRKEFNYKCCKCGKKRNLESHHIYPKHLFPNMREDLDNALLLCVKCHDEMHALLVKAPEEYYALVGIYNAKRTPMKSIPKKKRNPSSAVYKIYDEHVPEGGINPPPEPKVKKPRKSAKSKAQASPRNQ